MAEKSAPSEDYVFRYRLRLEPDRNALYQDPLMEMIRAQLANILNLVIPVAGGKELKLDGFKLLRDRDTIHKIFSREPDKGKVLGTGNEARHLVKTCLQNGQNAGL